MKVDIVIPVYKGLEETKKCIQSVLSCSNCVDSRIIVIDDASPDPDIKCFLQEQNDAILLLDNAKNQGFVYSVNRGMSYSDDRDVILLNSDTEVANGWIDKLYRCAYSKMDIGTVTPMSNSATICSYPRFCQDNSLPINQDIESMNKIFEAVSDHKAINTPTGVGFCLYIKRALLDQIGLFDLASFGRGYGEENDFCMRAYYNGWRNVICTDTYIYHHGSTSFGEERATLVKEAMLILNKKHPNYQGLVQSFLVSDPLKKFRMKVNVERFHRNEKPAILLISHNMHGGTARCVNEMGLEWISKGYNVFIVQLYNKHIVLRSADVQDDFTLRIDLEKDYSKLVNFCKFIHVQCIHYHHLLWAHDKVKMLPKDISCSYYVMLHDYYFICPRISLTYPDSIYCNEPDVAGCKVCLNKRPVSFSFDIAKWRATWSDFLGNAKKVAAPSQDVIKRMKRYLPDLTIDLVSHAEKRISCIKKADKTDFKKFRIAAIGGISPIKGADFIYDCAKDAKTRDLPLQYVVLGETYKQKKTKKDSLLEVTGGYCEADLLGLFKSQKIDIAFFPVRWPETYSYTLSWAILGRLPAVATDIGAIAERIKVYDIGWVFPLGQSAAEVNDIFIEILSNPKLYQQKCNNIDKVRFKQCFVLADYYDLSDLHLKQCKEFSFDSEGLYRSCMNFNDNNFKKRLWHFLLKRKHWPIIRQMNSIIGDRGKQKIKKFLRL